MSAPFFHFKQFSVYQYNATMKITTDSVLLGAWTDCSGAESILDVGAGTGVVALMLAQHCPGHISALEPDRKTSREMIFNILHSPWAKRIVPFQKSFQQFLEQNKAGSIPKFDLIVSNPPYFMRDLPSRDPGRASARHAVTLTYEELLAGAGRILTDRGKLSVIMPYRYESCFISLAADQKLYCNRMLEVRPGKKKAFFRVLMELGRKKEPLKKKTLTIHDGEGYSEEYKALTRDYYLDF